jgi:hypothetical protein
MQTSPLKGGLAAGIVNPLITTAGGVNAGLNIFPRLMNAILAASGSRTRAPLLPTQYPLMSSDLSPEQMKSRAETAAIIQRMLGRAQAEF